MFPVPGAAGYPCRIETTFHREKSKLTQGKACCLLVQGSACQDLRDSKSWGKTAICRRPA